MDPDEITRLANSEREKKKAEAERSKQEPFNLLDWMDFTRTRKWMKTHLALSDKFYSFIILLLMGAGLATYFYLLDEEKWALYLAISLWGVFFPVVVGGFIYGFIKGKNK